MSHSTLETRMQLELTAREKSFSLRRLHALQAVDFCSSDYLGFARNKELMQEILRSFETFELPSLGGTASRLICGNSSLHDEVEALLAQHLQAPEVLLFNSGYDANVGIFGALPKRHDVVLYDEYCHASIRDGLRLGFAEHFSFKHNSTEDLAKKLQRFDIRPPRHIFIACESIYSMGGDEAPLEAFVMLADKYGATLIVDEAHATGIFGENGAGLSQELGLQDRIQVRVHTFGKALGSHGACVCGNENLRNYLINFCRSFIYTTAVGSFALLSIEKGIQRLMKSTPEREQLSRSIEFFRKRTKELGILNASDNRGPIQFVQRPGSQEALALSTEMNRSGLDVRAILSPTVPSGSEGIRICLHSFNTLEEIERLLQSLRSPSQFDQRAA